MNLLYEEEHTPPISGPLALSPVNRPSSEGSFGKTIGTKRKSMGEQRQRPKFARQCPRK